MSEQPGIGVDPDLLQAWLCARSLSRGVPAPTRHGEGFVVETGSPHELRRYVFPRPSEDVRRLAIAVTDPTILLKLCASPQVMQSLLSPGWTVRPQNFVMTNEGPNSGTPPELPPRYRMEVSRDGGVILARIVTNAGDLAASGRAARHGGVFIYDQIVTDAAHRRLGLGRAIMRALEEAGRDPGDLQMLVATDDGRALYATLGWAVRAPYVTAARTPAPS